MHSFTEPTTITVDESEVFEIVLEGNFTTGYRWEVDTGDGAIELISEDMQAGGDAPGSRGTQHFKMRAGAKGSHTLRFVYRRPWENDRDAILDERDIKVHVI